MAEAFNNPQNTLRLNQHELHRILEILELRESQEARAKREFVRWSYRVEAVTLSIEHNSGNKVMLPVASRNISRGGMCILHSAFLHPGTPCEIILKVPGGKEQSIPGIVRRCSHVMGRAHEIGIEFNEQISTKDLLGLDPLNEAYSLERVDPARLHGSVLIVTDSDLDRELLSMYLEDTNLITNTAESIENAVSRAQKGIDLVLTDYHLTNATAPDLVHALHEAGCDMPIVVLTSDKSETTLDAIRECEASGILSKPTTKDKVLQAFAEFLHADGDGGPLYSALDDQDSAYPLLAKFLTRIAGMALDLEKAQRDDNISECLRVARSLSGIAAPLGFPEVSKLAIAVENKIAKTNLKAASHEIRSLIVACRRIKNRPAA